MKKKIDYSSINFCLGQNIARIRIENGYSQEAFALECGISRAYYGRCELGLHSFTIDKLQLICNLLNVTIPDLFYTKDNKYV